MSENTVSNQTEQDMSNVSSESLEKNAETKTEAKVEVDVAQVTNDDIFVTESDQFECTIKYYKTANDILVSNVDDNFDAKVPSKTLTFKCKYPSQADYQALINSQAFKGIGENISGIELNKLEMTRFSLLVRSWSVPQPLERLLDVDPKIIKGMLIAVNDVIGLKGLF